MHLLHQIAALHAAGIPRNEIAARLNLSERVVAWLMDSDSFMVVMAVAGGER